MHASLELRRAAAALPDHPNLDKVVDYLNLAKVAFRSPAIRLDRLTVKEVAEIRAFIRTALQPDFLDEDGELTYAEIAVKERVLRYAQTELAQLIRRTVRV